MARVKPDALRGSGALQADLRILLEAYEEELSSNHLTDEAGKYEAALACVQHGYPALPLVLLDLKLHHALERELLNLLTAAAPHVWIVERQPGLTVPASVDLFSAGGEALECVEIARKLLRHAAAGIPFDRMAVLLRSPSRYQPMVEEALRRAKIPAYFAHGTQRPHPAGRAFLLLLETALDGCTAARFSEYLSLRQVPDSAALSVAGWESLLNDANVIGGVERWQRRFSALEASLKLDLDKTEWKRTALEALRDFALPLITRLHALSAAKLTWREWVTTLAELAEAALEEPEAVVDTLDEFAILGDIGPVGLEEVTRRLEDHLRSLRVEPPSQRYGRVFIGTPEDARGRSFRLVCLPGLNEGMFPRPVAEDPLLLNQHRADLSNALKLADDLDERELLEVATASSTEYLIASYSRLDLMTGRPRTFSLYAYELMRAAGLDPANIPRAEPRVGWPAPHNPESAIDDSEYDLAILRPAFDGASASGLGAYLTEANAHLARSLRARWRRWKPKWSFSDGLVDVEIGTLEAFRLANKPYSSSVLEEFAACPYRFALRGLHQLRPLNEATSPLRMEPLIRGILFHEAVRRWLVGERTPSQLDARFSEVVAEAEELHFPAIPRIWRLEVERLRADLLGWLRQREGEWDTIAVEHEFTDLMLFGKYRVKGKIDLVERHPSIGLRVVDHKTGKVPSPLPMSVGKGEVLQPALYALAAEQLFGETVSTSRLHYATLRANFRKHDIQMHNGTRTAFENVLMTIESALDAGFLPAAPRTDACKDCDYRPICGPYEEERTKAKSQEELRALKRLRGMF